MTDSAGEQRLETIPYLVLAALRAETEAEFEEDELAAQSLAERLRNPAVNALGIAAQWLRSETGSLEVDVYGRGVTARYVDAKGKELSPFYTIDFWNLKFPKTVGGELWQVVQQASSRLNKPPLIDNLILDAGVFLQEGNFRMAVLNAAIACELKLYELVVSALTDLGGIAPGSARAISQEVSNKELPAILGCFYETSPDDISGLQTVFSARNNILHMGGGATEPTARAAIATAKVVATLRRRTTLWPPENSTGS